jgi:ferredoxin
VPLKLILTPEKCQGHARCMRKGPDVYRLNAKGFLETVPVTVPPGLEAQAIAGAEACPEGAIEIRREG